MASKAPTLDKSKALSKTPTREITELKKTTRIQVNYDVGFGNSLSIRGEGANLSWSKGTLLKNIKNDEWLFETDLNFSEIEFKILLNDTCFETGPNHIIEHGNYLKYHPTFN